MAAVWAAAAIQLHASSATREQERTRNNFMDVVRLGSLDEVCFGKGSAHRLPVVLRGREGPPYGSRGLTGGRLSVAGFVVHDSDFHADLSGLTISSQKES